jgi:hypothetical protein
MVKKLSDEPETWNLAEWFEGVNLELDKVKLFQQK